MKKLLAILVTTMLLVSVMAPLAMAEDSGFVDGKFTETRTITVAHFDRDTEGWDVDNNVFIDFIKKSMLDQYNVKVEFVTTPRWTESDNLPTYLAAGTACDVSYTYSDGTIETYFKQDAVMDLAPLLEEYAEYLTDMTEFFGTNLTWKLDPNEGTIYAIPAVRIETSRINTFVREDWLEKLGLAIPTTTQEFEDMLVAFKDNAETLLGDDASMMVPFSMTEDVGWVANNILFSFVSEEDVTDKTNYIYGYDDRQFLYPGAKEGARLLNKWFNDGLILQDFSLYAMGDSAVDNLIKAGFVGAFESNWDYPYTKGDESIYKMLIDQRGEDAKFIAIDPFLNDAGISRKVLYSSNGIYIFFPNTNTEPLASLLYLNWMAKLENRMYLQFGEEGITWEYNADGVKTLLTPDPGYYTRESSNNIDTTMIINGLDQGDAALNAQTKALSYAGVEPSYVETAWAMAMQNGISFANINLGSIAAEEGMGEVLKEKRDETLNTAINASMEDFDAVWDAGMADYLSSGGQAIIDERMEKYNAAYGE